MRKQFQRQSATNKQNEIEKKAEKKLSDSFKSSNFCHQTQNELNWETPTAFPPPFIRLSACNIYYSVSFFVQFLFSFLKSDSVENNMFDLEE